MNKEIEENSRTIWCGNLSEEVTEELLYELFLQAGPLEEVKIPRDRDGRQRNFAFITYRHEVSAPYAIELYRDTALFQRTLCLRGRGRMAPLPPPIKCFGPELILKPEPTVQFSDITEKHEDNDLRRLGTQGNRETGNLEMANSIGTDTRASDEHYTHRQQERSRDNYCESCPEIESDNYFDRWPETQRDNYYDRQHVRKHDSNYDIEPDRERKTYYDREPDSGRDYQDRGRDYQDSGRDYQDRGRDYQDSGRDYHDRRTDYQDRGRDYQDSGRDYQDIGRVYQDRRTDYQDRGRDYQDSRSVYHYDECPEQNSTGHQSKIRCTPTIKQQFSDMSQGLQNADMSTIYSPRNQEIDNLRASLQGKDSRLYRHHPYRAKNYDRASNKQKDNGNDNKSRPHSSNSRGYRSNYREQRNYENRNHHKR